MPLPSLDQDRLDELVARPAESLNIEIKSWLNPATRHGMAKIVRAAIAIRNRNGGYIILGLDDATLQPVSPPLDLDVAASFHLDDIQGMVAKYSSERFEIAVGFGNRDGQSFPIIAIPDGVRTPVAAKVDLIDGGKKLITKDTVYFRTLSANNTPSTSAAHYDDWHEIVEICFDNREADIGRFLRRHLGERDISTLIGQIREVSAGAVNTMQIPASPTDIVDSIIRNGDQRWERAISARALDTDEQLAVARGAWTVALAFQPYPKNGVANIPLLQAIASSNPQYTGWPVWLDARTFTNADARPRVLDKAWETLILSAKGWSSHVEFAVVYPDGRLYLRRILQDDLTDKVQPGTALEPILTILRVAEAIAVGLAVGKGLGLDAASTRATFGFRWTGLRGRELDVWANPLVGFIHSDQSHQDEVVTAINISLDTSPTAIAPAVNDATKELFAAFGGKEMPMQAIEHWVQRLIERKL